MGPLRVETMLVRGKSMDPLRVETKGARWVHGSLLKSGDNRSTRGVHGSLSKSWDNGEQSSSPAAPACQWILSEVRGKLMSHLRCKKDSAKKLDLVSWMERGAKWQKGIKKRKLGGVVKSRVKLSLENKSFLHHAHSTFFLFFASYLQLKIEKNTWKLRAQVCAQTILGTSSEDPLWFHKNLLNKY